MTLGELFAALQSSDWSRLPGTAEGDQIDFKAAPYELGQDRHKWELAKDVAAFANKNGGAIVIGVETQRHAHDVVDAATSVRPVAKATVGPDQYRSVIGSWVHPPPLEIRLHWFPPDVTVAEGLFVVEVPPQPDHLKPFLVRRTVEEGGAKFDAIAIPRRDGDRVAWESVEEIQRQLADRRRLILRPEPEPPRGAAPDRAVRAEARVTETLRLQGWTGEPVYLLQALPHSQAEPVRGLYSEVQEALRNPEVVSPRGFALRWRVNLELYEGGLVIRHREGVTWVDRDGLATEGHLLEEESHLGWFYNQDRAPGDPLILHPIAALEVTLEFFRFVDRVLRPRLSADGWTHRIICLNFHTSKVILPAGRPGTREEALLFVHPAPLIASSDDWRQGFEDLGTPQRNAYRALRELYALFGLEAEAIPLTEGESVSEAQLAALRG